jgi:hypothetical protein
LFVVPHDVSTDPYQKIVISIEPSEVSEDELNDDLDVALDNSSFCL